MAIDPATLSTSIAVVRTILDAMDALSKGEMTDEEFKDLVDGMHARGDQAVKRWEEAKQRRSLQR